MTYSLCFLPMMKLLPMLCELVWVRGEWTKWYFARITILTKDGLITKIFSLDPIG